MEKWRSREKNSGKPKLSNRPKKLNLREHETYTSIHYKLKIIYIVGYQAVVQEELPRNPDLVIKCKRLFL